MAEADVMRRLQVLASKLGARLFRQQVGMAWVGNAERFGQARTVRVNPGDVLVRKARPFHAGVNGMSDMGGWVPVEITPDMVGSTVAVYAQIEVKVNTSASKEQRAWIEAVNAAGGRAGVARTDQDLCDILRGIHG